MPITIEEEDILIIYRLDPKTLSGFRSMPPQREGGKGKNMVASPMTVGVFKRYMVETPATNSAMVPAWSAIE
jgi:hypothetical protein